MPKFAVILPAAGNSTRFGDPLRKKPFVELKGRPMWVRAADLFVERPDVIKTYVVVAPEDVEWFKDKFRPNLAFMNVAIVAGGKTRAESVGNALKEVDDAADFIAVHDAARPLIVRPWIEQVFAAAERTGAAILASPISSTVKRAVNGRVTETVDRENLFAAQTPQVARADWLREAYAEGDVASATDESQLLERLGKPVEIVKCSPLNFKITTKEDFHMAEHCLAALPKEKGLRALHPFADERPGLF